MLRDAVAEAVLAQKPADLVHLAAEAQHHHMGEIGVPRIAGEGAAQDVQAFARGHPAAGLVGERHDAVHIREIGEWLVPGERIALEGVGDEARGVRAAVHRGEDADVVARRDAAIRPHDALEGGGSGK